MHDALAQATPSAAVPQAYAEKAMATLMQLHTELMDEKERRVDLYRRLMEREQALAELRMYVKVLEERAEASKAAAPPVPSPVVAAPARVASPKPVPQKAPVIPTPRRSAPATYVSVGARRGAAAPPGWRSW